ncbi:hypothetical protein DKX38_030098 (mitochondrion) [Salix brachista]|uniref:Uncharacterized protein n=1 Tax=Salix brachista TaxID=2182728 RepID=A0A5N5J1Q8_9ROSI|nr:hypothetical protein DKX38_030098 [Salix brachista]
MLVNRAKLRDDGRSWTNRSRGKREWESTLSYVICHFPPSENNSFDSSTPTSRESGESSISKEAFSVGREKFGAKACSYRSFTLLFTGIGIYFTRWNKDQIFLSLNLPWKIQDRGKKSSPLVYFNLNPPSKYVAKANTDRRRIAKGIHADIRCFDFSMIELFPLEGKASIQTGSTFVLPLPEPLVGKASIRTVLVFFQDFHRHPEPPLSQDYEQHPKRSLSFRWCLGSTVEKARRDLDAGSFQSDLLLLPLRDGLFINNICHRERLLHGYVGVTAVVPSPKDCEGRIHFNNSRLQRSWSPSPSGLIETLCLPPDSSLFGWNCPILVRLARLSLQVRTYTGTGIRKNPLFSDIEDEEISIDCLLFLTLVKEEKKIQRMQTIWRIPFMPGSNSSVLSLFFLCNLHSLKLISQRQMVKDLPAIGECSGVLSLRFRHSLSLPGKRSGQSKVVQVSAFLPVLAFADLLVRKKIMEAGVDSREETWFKVGRMELLDGKTGLGAAGLTVLSEAEVSYAKHPGVRFPRYAVLGDDVLIADTCVSQVYEQALSTHWNGMLKTISAFVSPGRRVQNGINQTLRLSALIRRMKSQVFRFFG